MEFLPLCDVLFNIISLAGYFCDVVFDVVFCYALLERGRTTYSAVVICSITFSLITSQIVSLRWYLNKSRADSTSSSATNSIDKKHQQQNQQQQEQQQQHQQHQQIIEQLPVKSVKFGKVCVIALHCGMLGVLWRYAKLFVPVDLRHVKHEVRDLCMLRILHAFCEAAPMLLLQLHVYVTMQNEDYVLSTPEIKLKSLGGQITSAIVPNQPTKAQEDQINLFKELIVISVLLSLFSVCWALASFSKNVRLQNVHRLVLTWLGVIFQFIWRLGTIVSRVASLTVYASLYGYWIFLVIILHWISMFLWLISPKNVFHGERISRLRKATLVGLIAFVYVFAYINLQEVKHRQKMVTFYVVMFLENSLLVCLWLVGIWSVKPDNWYMVPMLVFFSFAIGMAFMVLYYRYFHVRRLGYLAGGRPSEITSKGGGNHRVFISNDSHFNDGLKYSPHAIPGVFNCRFTNPVGNCATKRKKKKPTTFIPPPTLLSSLQNNADQSNGLMSIPFWRRPLPRSQTGGSSENEGSAGSRVNIHQKLQEKKQKQLAELKIIEEEIKQGKLGGPSFATNLVESGDDGRESLLRQPIPRTKKHINVEPIEWRGPSPDIGTGNKVFNDLNVLSPNLDEVNKLNKYANYDPLYNSFGLNGINIPALAKENFVTMESTARNMSPISSQMSATESNSLTRPAVLPRSKIPHNLPRNPFAETYRNNFSNVYADGANNRSTSMSPRNTSNSPSRGALFDHHAGLYLDINHPRQISGTYSSMEHSGVENLPFPYSVIPPPKSKLDSRQTPTAPVCAKSFAQQRLTQRQMQRAKTPEILLAPHYLDNSRIYYEWAGREQSLTRFKGNDQHRLSSGDENLDDRDESVLDGDLSGRMPSDIDSQMSLPRSYTLPREYKYYRRNKPRKLIKNEHFITSTNSSDGDVDSGDDNESERQSNQSSNRTSNNSQRRSSHVRKNNFQHSSPTSTALKSNNNNNNNTSSPLSHQQPSSSLLHITPATTNYINAASNVIGKPLNGVPVVGGGSSGLNANNPMNRHRLRAYGNGKGAMVRHETKL